jgi:hypothetical protein
MGDLMRRYWVPVLLTSEIAEPDCPPVRTKVSDMFLSIFSPDQVFALSAV